MPTKQKNVWADKAAAHRKIGHLREAIACYDSSLKYSPLSADTWYWRGIALDGSSLLSRAIKSYDSAITYERDMARAWDARAASLQRLGRLEEALQSVDSALKYNPEYEPAKKQRKHLLGEKHNK